MEIHSYFRSLISEWIVSYELGNKTGIFIKTQPSFLWVFLHLACMKYSQINTKPFCTPRKLIWELTQQSAQPELQNSAGSLCREVNWGREKPWRAGSCFCLWREDRDAGGEFRKSTPTKSSWRESGKVETATGTEQKREKGQRRKEKREGLNSIKIL